VVLREGIPLAWFDRRSHHLVTFPAADTDHGWAEALAASVKNGRVRSVEVRKVNGEPITPNSSWAAALAATGFVEGYRGWVARS
jgi:ATP-dependent Lhr-like helicase